MRSTVQFAFDPEDPARRQFFAALTALGLGSEALRHDLFAQASQAPQSRVTAAMVKEAVELAGLKYTEAEQQGMVASLNRILLRAEELHQAPPDNDAPSPILFNPRVPGFPVVVPTRVHRPLVGVSFDHRTGGSGSATSGFGR